MDYPNKHHRYLRILNKILVELSLEYLSTNIGFHNVLNEDDISAELIYSILPYCKSVCNKNPMQLSETLQKYIGRCPHKDLIGEWFINE